MSAYLSAHELSDMIGCEPNSYACMCRWLKRNAWPYETNLRGFPRVSRAYHDARLSGASAQVVAEAANEPDFSMFSV